MAAAKEVRVSVMKKLILSLVLLFAAGYSSLAFVAIFFPRFSFLVTVENLTCIFTVAVLGLIFVADYSRRARPRRPKIGVSDRRPRETHRLAA
jgi:hypothetical protein